VRIVTYNVHSCIGTDGRCAPERIAAVLAEIDPDVVCLQELEVDRPRSGLVDQAAEVARILTMEFHFNPTITEVSGRYGDAILSKKPFKLIAAGSLPPAQRPIPREPRGAIRIETAVNGQTWQIINTHFGLGHGERRFQARAMVEKWIIPALAHSPVILCGDFNSRPSSAVHRIIGERLRDVLQGKRHPRSFSTRWPFVCLDYVFASEGVRVERVECWKSPLADFASDHFPIVAELTAE
jgi:endonuclease/exonuclease/phosphatase family metal-dependent hydrolase